MSYDAASFRAGLALGRLLWRPPSNVDTLYQVRMSDIDVSQSYWRYGLLQTAQIVLPDTHVDYYPWGSLAGIIDWTSKNSYSWDYRYEVIPDSGSHNLVIGWSALYTTLYRPGYTAWSLGNSPFYDVTFTVNGIERHETANYKYGSVDVSTGIQDLNSLFTNGTTGYSASGILKGTIWLPKLLLLPNGVTP